MSDRVPWGVLLTAPLLVGLALAGAVPVSADTTTTLHVTTNQDLAPASAACPATSSAPCTLRAAVAVAVAAANPVDIVFDVAGPLTLSNGSLLVSGGTVGINGPTTGTIVIKGSADRLFTVSGSSTALLLSHVFLTDGAATTSSGNSGIDDGFGGAIDVNTGAALTVLDSVITGNTAEQNAGAIDDNTTSAVRVVRSTLSNNTAGGLGGAIDTNTDANLSLINSTVHGNTATSGGAINAVTGASITLVNDTIANNKATTPGPATPGAILGAANSAVSVTNTVFAGNTAPTCTTVGLTDAGHNAEDGTSCGFTNHAVSAAAKLGPLRDNGGPTPTMAPGPDSPLLAAGDLAACGSTVGAADIDQRGVARPQPAAATTCDIGAVETIATTTAVTGIAGVTVAKVATLTVTVTATTGLAGAPDGSVTVYDGATSLGTAARRSAPSTISTSPVTVTYTIKTPPLTAGSHDFKAVYAATSLFLGSTAHRGLAVAAAVRSNSGGVLADTGMSPLLPLAAVVATLLALGGVRLRTCPKQNGR
jgi:hypothetical protein